MVFKNPLSKLIIRHIKEYGLGALIALSMLFVILVTLHLGQENINKQKRVISTLEDRIDDLETKVNDLQNEVDDLEDYKETKELFSW